MGLEAAHGVEKASEFSMRRIKNSYRSQKLKPYRTLAKAEKRSISADVNVLYQKSVRDSPQRASNPLSKWQQKQAIKKQYLAKRYGQSTTQNTASTLKTAVKKGMDSVTKAIAVVMKNPKVILLIAAIFLVIAMTITAMTSLSVLFQGALINVVATSYTSENEELIAADNHYTTLETVL